MHQVFEECRKIVHCTKFVFLVIIKKRKFGKYNIPRLFIVFFLIQIVNQYCTNFSFCVLNYVFSFFEFTNLHNMTNPVVSLLQVQEF